MQETSKDVDCLAIQTTDVKNWDQFHRHNRSNTLTSLIGLTTVFTRPILASRYHATPYVSMDQLNK